MSQVIKYWSLPNTPYTYNYASMPATSGNSYVEKLMSDAGNLVGMSYACGSSGAEDSYVKPV